MLIGERLRQLREKKGLSQGDIETKTGLIRCYTSRVENNHTVPAIETLEKFARALEVPLYELFIEEGAAKPKNGKSPIRAHQEIFEDRHAQQIAKFMPKITPRDRNMLVKLAASMARAR